MQEEGRRGANAAAECRPYFLREGAKERGRERERKRDSRHAIRVNAKRLCFITAIRFL